MTASSDPATRLADEIARAGRRRGARRTLLLDLDGTLAPLAPTPAQARVPEGTLGSLRRLIRQGWTVGVVSGRPAAQVRRLVPIRGVRVFGSHGAEGSWDGRAPARVSAAVRDRLKSLLRRARSVAQGVPGAHVEEKPAGLALHDRNVRHGDLPGWRARLREMLATADLEGLDVLAGHRVIEIRPRGYHKGVVVESLPGRPRKLDASLVAVGDDRTDEDLFRALAGKGLSVRVGRPSVPTRATRRLPSPRAVGRFLAGLADRSAPASPGRTAPRQP